MAFFSFFFSFFFFFLLLFIFLGHSSGSRLKIQWRSRRDIRTWENSKLCLCGRPDCVCVFIAGITLISQHFDKKCRIWTDKT